MNDKGNTLLLAIIAIAVIIVVVGLAYMGVLPLSLTGLIGDNDGDGVDTPIGSDYCGYSTGEIVGMFENLAGKNLNNDVGFSVVNALNVEACGSNSKTPYEIISNYKMLYNDGWYILSEDGGGGSGYTYDFVVWGNTDSVFTSTLIRSVLSGSGVSVSEWYGYSTITASGYGTRSGYLAFHAWLRS